MAKFTNREYEVMREIVGRLSNAEIALKLGVRTSTLNGHISNIYRKLEIRSRRDFRAWALKHLNSNVDFPPVRGSRRDFQISKTRHREAGELKEAMANAGIFDPHNTDFLGDGAVFAFATDYFRSMNRQNTLVEELAGQLRPVFGAGGEDVTDADLLRYAVGRFGGAVKGGGYAPE